MGGVQTLEAPTSLPWYKQLVFEGELLQPPWFIGSDDLMLLTNDSVLRRFNFDDGLMWRHDFERIPRGTWYVQKNGSIHVPMQEELLFFSGGGLTGRDSFPWPEPAPGELLASVDGRLVNIQVNGEVELFPGLSLERDVLTRWKLPSAFRKKLLLSPQGNIILQTENSLFWYSLDGRLLAEESISNDWNNFIFAGNELLIHSPLSGEYRRYTLSGKLISSGSATGRGELITVLPLDKASSKIYLHIDNADLLLYGPGGEEHELLHLDSPWEYGHIARHGAYLYLSDSAWRLHRFDMNGLAEDFF